MSAKSTGARLRTDVLAGDRVDVPAHVRPEVPQRPPSLGLVGGLARTAEVLQRKLAVHRHDPLADEDRGVDDGVAEPVLHLPAPLRQHLRERLLEERLAERPAQLRRLQQVLEPRHVAGELLDLLRGLVDPAHLLADVLQAGARTCPGDP